MNSHRDQIWTDEETSWIFRKMEREIFQQKASSLTGKILEIGPGYGRILSNLMISKKDIVGLEISKNLYDQLRKKGYKVIQGSALYMPFENETFNAVILEEVIEHISDQKKLISEICRVLKKDGTIIFSTPNKWIYRFFMYLSNIKNRLFSLKLL